ncbi:40S ribosomal protein S11 isoform B [Pitangus sulphuratus]|nr:40S ribosomal protein S11 isoform B [Pitangus sulphuratus]
MADTQTECVYQKQPTIFQNKKRVLLCGGGKEKLSRYYRNMGLGFKIPKEAIEGTYIDKDVQIGDIVTVDECHPLSKTVGFSVLK